MVAAHDRQSALAGIDTLNWVLPELSDTDNPTAMDNLGHV